MKFGELMKHQSKGLVIGERHDEWLKRNGNPTYSESALRFLSTQLMLQSKPRDRRGTVSASSLGSCRRRQSFTYLGMSELPPSPKTAQIFQNGTYMHLRWQAAGLTEGWLKAAEVPVPENQLRLSGTQDGIAYDDSVVELKSINTNGFSGVKSFGVKPEHRFQVGTYMVVTGAEKGVVVYEDKNTQEYEELIVELDQQLIDDVNLTSEAIYSHIDNKKLAEPLEGCMERKGWRYASCPFRDRCLAIRDWEHAEETANG